MKSVVSALSVLLFLAACASTPQQGGPNVAVQLQQINSPNEVFYYRGPVNVQYRVAISNPTAEQLTLQRLDLQTIGPGAYSLRANGTPMNLKVPPNSTAVYTISVWGYARGGYLASTEPVTLRGTAYFQGPTSGAFIKMFNENISPYSGS
ncbi:MAG TPA: hypothetical protein VJ853_10175 [Thermoanaerobaculia bacterium]|nr:hypothetical protein [Thermoanaerobaculia bacterium]